MKKLIFFYFREKISQCRKKTERRNSLEFSNIHSVAKHQKMQGGPFEEKKIRKKIRKNVSQCRKKIERGDSLVSPGMVCYAEKQVKPFWSSSLGQMVQFDTIIFCRTFKNYFGQFVWIEKKRVTIIVAFHFMKRRLKNNCENKLFSTFSFSWQKVSWSGNGTLARKTSFSRQKHLSK